MEELFARYGWQAIKTKTGYDFINKKGNKVSYVQIKGKKYIFYAANDYKLLSGNKNVIEAAKELLEKYYFAEPV